VAKKPSTICIETEKIVKTVFKRKFNRRSFIKNSIRLSILAFLGFGFERRNNIKTESIGLKFSNLPSAFDGFRIVQISDLHASYWVGKKYLMSMVEKINKLEKDLVIITGDIITGAVNDFWKRWMPTSKRDYLAMAIDVLGNLEDCDKIAVLGNHDQWDGKKTELRVVNELEKIGFYVLRNSSMPVSRGKESIYISGTDDIWFSYNLSKAMHKVPGNAFKILLSHSPDVTTDIENDMQIDLTLCGHTHGGQVNIPYISHHFIPINNPSKYKAGLIKEPYGYTYVNRGIGTLVFPFRFCAPPEITYLRLN
jgi:predicted MPP superfamily phosphohydrolase